jgi:hypothetical protein
MDHIATNTGTDAEDLTEFHEAIRKHQFANQARAKLEAATPLLIHAIRCSEASPAIEGILCSVWNGQLCNQLPSLDTNLAEAILAMIAARVHMGEEADVLLGKILYETDTMSKR